MSDLKIIDEIKEKLKLFNDDNFKFDTIKHQYTYNGNIMNGTTSFLDKRFVKPFNSDYYSRKKANEAGITQAEMLAIWDQKRDSACDLGHTVHDYIEEFYEKNSTKLPDNDEAKLRIEKFHTIYNNELNKLISIGSEIKVFSKKYNLAGTIDKLYYYNGAIIIGDWKTNKKIKTDKDFCFGKLLYPFEKLKENEINKYSLQLSIYALILEEVGIIVDYFFICHIPGDGDAKIYKTKDLRTELKTYFNHQNLLIEEFNLNDEDDQLNIDMFW